MSLSIETTVIHLLIINAVI